MQMSDVRRNLRPSSTEGVSGLRVSEVSVVFCKRSGSGGGKARLRAEIRATCGSGGRVPSGGGVCASSGGEARVGRKNGLGGESSRDGGSGEEIQAAEGAGKDYRATVQGIYVKVFKDVAEGLSQLDHPSDVGSAYGVRLLDCLHDPDGDTRCLVVGCAGTDRGVLHREKGRDQITGDGS